MDGSDAVVWWVAAGVAVAVELVSGTFYLLMLALGAAAGALAAHAGAGATAQIVAAALVGGGATVALYLRRRSAPVAAPSERNADVNIDIGQTVQVAAWSSDGSARVPYRGASWSARHVGDGAPQPGQHVIVGMHGSELQLQRAAPR